MLMFLTSGLPFRHPIVVLATINVALALFHIYWEAVVLGNPPGRLPYVLQLFGSLLGSWSSIIVVAEADNLGDHFMRSVAQKAPPELVKLIANCFLILGYGTALFFCVVVCGLFYQHLFAL